jgi:hypothetical protein
MKKIALSFAAFLLILTQGFAQDKNGSFGISIGSSIPMGDYKSTKPNDKSGWAKTGLVLDLTLNHRIGENNYGIAVMLRGQANPFDAQAYADELAKQFPGVTALVRGEAWSTSALLIGGFVSVPASYNISFETRFMIGSLNATSPKIDVTISDSKDSITINQESGTAKSFAYLIGAGFTFELSPSMCLLTNLDYLGAEPEFKNVKYTSNKGESDAVDFKQDMGTLNITAGIAVNF